MVWEIDLVQRFAAEPVQFGFSASPIPYDDSVIVLAGGQQGGLVCLRIQDGSLKWHRPCREASYATPVLWRRHDSIQVVFVTRDDVVGVTAEDGKELWRFALPESGLTNVPTPLPVGKEGLIVSGQGNGGTRRLEIHSQDNAWTASEAWFSRVEFFYCNWIARDGMLLGCGGDLFFGLDLATGRTRGRWRGLGDSNLVSSQDQLFILDGSGSLNSLAFAADKLKHLGTYRLFEQRCWTAPSLLGTELYCRGEDRLVCIDLSPMTGSTPLATEKLPMASLEFSQGTEAEVAQPGATPLDRIVEAFQTDGLEAAWELYGKIRDREPTSLTIEQRRELMQMASEQNLDDLVQQLREHMIADFPDNKKIKQLLSEAGAARRNDE